MTSKFMVFTIIEAEGYPSENEIVSLAIENANENDRWTVVEINQDS